MKEQILEDVIQNGVTCSLRMRFECTIMKAKSHKGKSYVDLEKEIEAAAKDGIFRTHTMSESYSILNDLVVVSSLF